MYNLFKLVAGAAVLVIFVSVGKRMSGFKTPPELSETTVSQALIRQEPNSPPGFPPLFSGEAPEPAWPANQPSDEALKAAILSVRHPPPTPEDGYEVNGVG